MCEHTRRTDRNEGDEEGPAEAEATDAEALRRLSDTSMTGLIGGASEQRVSQNKLQEWATRSAKADTPCRGSERAVGPS